MDYVSDVGRAPLSVQEIAAKAIQFDYNNTIPLRYWLRTADTLLKEADIYEREGNEQQAYMLLLRHAELVLKYLPDHPDAKLAEYARHMRALKTVTDDIRRLERLKPRIFAQYVAYEEAQKEREARRAALDANRTSTRSGSSSPAAETQKLDAQFAVQVARKEFARREAERLARGRPSSLTPSPAPLPQFPPSIVSTPPTDTSYDRPSPPPVPPLPESLRPPAVPKKTPLPPLTPPPLPTPPAPFSATSPPSLPSLPLTLTSPPPPPKLPLELIAPSTTITISPSKQRLLSDFQFPSTARLESGQRLRTIFLPSLLRHKFLAIAFPNTRRNLETCGVLCGTLIQNALFISRLVIPEQVVTSDTCNMTDEESLFHYVDSEDLMVLGWIHTHPMYECFMSSVDLHNHCGYQLMLPESIAVVCAPRFTPDWGVFRLTDPPGVKRIMECREKSLFHRHEGAEGLYTDALRPGHVVEVGEMEFEVVDLRK
ncbi:hypothetical protein BDZ91DRAFT_658552 [Kalaharituber pfeilii]|nr:hypothetical protein BDZ91DRAFT_658552 [Kalaharituber pfeilii]